MKTVVITRKIELRPNLDNIDEKNNLYNELRKWRDVCFKSANYLVSQLFFILSQGDFAYLSEKGKRMVEDRSIFSETDKEKIREYFKNENKEIYKQVAEDEKEMIIGSTQNAFYNVLSARYLTQCPSNILTSLNQRIFKTFKENRASYLSGIQSIPSYRNTIPIPFQAHSILNVRRHVVDGKVTKDFGFTLFKQPLRTNFGIDRSNNAYIMRQAFSAWFLPTWVWDLEAQLSEYLVNFAGLKDNVVIGEREFKVEAAHADGKIFYYAITTSHEEKEIEFRMTPGEETLRDEKGELMRDDKGKRIRKKIYKITSNMRLLDSSIQLSKGKFEDKAGNVKETTKIFLLAVVEFEKEKHPLVETEVAYAKLSPEQPITARNGNKEFLIGSKDDFLYRRRGIEGALRRTQRDLKGVKGGRGRKKKLKALEQFKNYERDVVKSKLHKYSKELINFCLNNQCKYLHLQVTSLSDKELEEQQMIIRFWSPSMLINYIQYKAEKVGIEVVEE